MSKASLLAVPILVSLALVSVADDRAQSRPVESPEAACELLQGFFVRIRAVPEAGPSGEGWAGWYCETLPFDNNAFYLLGLHSKRNVGSNNMGYYAVRKATGELYDFDMAELKVGAPMQSSVGKL